MKFSDNTISLSQIRFLTSKVLAYATLQVFPNAQLIKGGPTDTGFYYDFYSQQPIVEEFLPLVAEKMRAIAKADIAINPLEMMRENAALFFEHHGQPLLAEQILQYSRNVVSIIEIEGFRDVGAFRCPMTTKEALHFKLISVTTIALSDPILGDIQSTRIIGTAFADADALKKFMRLLSTAKKNEHQKYLSQKHLTYMPKEITEGCSLWSPKGTALRHLIMQWWEMQHRAQDFKPVITPRLLPGSLLQKEGTCRPNKPAPASLFPPMQFDKMEHFLASSHAPSHALLFKQHPPYEHELPVRFSECGDLFFCEESDDLLGLLRTRSCFSDDAFIFCQRDHALSELISSLRFINKTVTMLDFKHYYYLNGVDVKIPSLQKEWDESLQWLKEALETCQMTYSAEDMKNTSRACTPMERSAYRRVERGYGPSIDIHLIDSLERRWSGPSLRVDVIHPSRFELYYGGANHTKHRPVMIGRSLFGSMERLIALLLEYHEGNIEEFCAQLQKQMAAQSLTNI